MSLESDSVRNRVKVTRRRIDRTVSHYAIELGDHVA